MWRARCGGLRIASAMAKHLLSPALLRTVAVHLPIFLGMDDDETVVTTFIERLDNGELDGEMNPELAQLSYEQLLRVSQILMKGVEK